MPDIFLSYTEKDREQARRVAAVLEAAGWSIWWDRRIPAGKTWRQVLEKALNDMRCMVVLWSSRSIESEWVFEEASEGRRQGKLVPVMLEAVRPPAGFREIHAADLANWDGTAEFEGMRLLLADLEQLLGKPTPAPLRITPKTAQEPAPAGTDPYDDGPANQPVGDDKGNRRRKRAIVAVTVSMLGVAFTVSLTLMRQGPVATLPIPDQPQASTQAPDNRPPSNSTQPLNPATNPQPPLTSVPVETSVKRTPLPVKEAKRGSETTQRAASVSARCANLQSRIELGEPLTPEMRAKYLKECQS